MSKAAAQPWTQLSACPCCGQPDWASRYKRLLLAAWMAVILAALLGLASLEAGVTAYGLEKLTTHGPFGLVVKRSVRIYSDEYVLLMGYLGAASLAIGLIGGALATIVLPHWRRIFLAGLLLLIPSLVAAALVVFWHREAPNLFAWGVRQILWLAALQIAGALIGVLAGRPFARILARLLLPPAWRGSLAFLAAGHNAA